MRKSTIIAKCLVSGGHISQLSDAEVIAERYFNEAFPQLDFNEWNTTVDLQQSELFLQNINFNSPIQLDKLVKELQTF